MFTRHQQNLPRLTALAALVAISGMAQESELTTLATSLASQVKRRARDPVAIISIANNRSCPAFSTYLVGRLNIYLSKNSADIEVVTRERVEEVFKEINLALGKNYDAATFATVGKHLGARSLIRGTYTLQAQAATISVATEILDVQTGRIIGGEIATIPFTTDLKTLLDGCIAPTDTPQKQSVETDREQSKSQTIRAGKLEVTLQGCSAEAEGVLCKALVTNTGEERQYCLVSQESDMMSRMIDEAGNVKIANYISLAEKRGSFSWVCARLPNGVPVNSSLLFSNRQLSKGRKAPSDNAAKPERLRLVELGFDVLSYGSRSPTSFFARFTNVEITQ